MTMAMDDGQPADEVVFAYTVKEVAKRMRCGLDTVYDLFADGVLKGFRLKPNSQKGIRIFPASLDEHMGLKSGQPQPQQEATAVREEEAKSSPAKKTSRRQRATATLILRHPA